MAAAEEKMMSLEELKKKMFQSLRDTGTIDMIRVRLCHASEYWLSALLVILTHPGASATALH